MKGLSISKIFKVISKTNNRCAYCGIELNENNFTIDHIVAKIQGGDNSLSNLFAACKSCNSTKQSRSLEWFRYYLTCKKYNIPRFSDKQLMYLKKVGVYEKCIPTLIRFYFETLNECN